MAVNTVDSWSAKCFRVDGEAGHPPGNAFVGKRMFCMVLADRPHGSCIRAFFLNLVSGWSQNSKTNLNTLCIDDAIAPPLNL